MKTIISSLDAYDYLSEILDLTDETSVQVTENLDGSVTIRKIDMQDEIQEIIDLGTQYEKTADLIIEEITECLERRGIYENDVEILYVHGTYIVAFYLCGAGLTLEKYRPSLKGNED